MNKIDKNCILHEACILVRYKQKLRKIYSKFYSRIKRDKYQEEKMKWRKGIGNVGSDFCRIVRKGY